MAIADLIQGWSILVQKLNEELVEEILRKPTKLSTDQMNAVLSESKYNRVIAGAGAGKTETLTRRIVYLILAEEVEPSSIVAFTFVVWKLSNCDF